jgi:flagellar hook-length control protein FliK
VAQVSQAGVQAAATVAPAPVQGPVAQAGPAAPTAPTVPVTQAALVAQLGPRALAAAVAATTAGIHTVTVHLRPAQLGSVQVVATLGDAGALDVRFFAADESTRETLRAALSDLRTDLASAPGVQVGSLDVSDQAPQQQGRFDGPPQRSVPRAVPDTPQVSVPSGWSPPVPVPAARAGEGRIDLRV